MLKYYFRLSEMSDYLFVCNLHAEFQTISNAECDEHYKPTITEKQICVYDAKNPSASRRRTCRGDSGGPLMCDSEHNVLVGVHSYGAPNCSASGPRVLTRVSEYRDWIQKNADIFRRGMFVSLSFCRCVSD